jgi:malate dehydrogenase
MGKYNRTVNVAVTGAAGRIGYSLIFRLAAGDLFGENVTINLRMLEIPAGVPTLCGMQMELEDCGFSTLGDVIITEDPDVAFGDADYVFMMGAKPRLKGMERSDLLEDNAKIFAAHGRSLGKFASPKVKVLVAGNPSNTNTLVALHNAPELNASNFTGMMQLDVNRAKAIVSKYTGVDHTDINDIIIWGNHSTTLYPDLSHAQIKGIPAFVHLGMDENVQLGIDNDWYTTEFIPSVQNRGAAVIECLGASSAASAANAAIQQMKMWDSKGGSQLWDSMAVLSEGQYGVDSDLIFSFPIRHARGKLWVVDKLGVADNLDIDEYSASMIKLSEAELIKERDTVKHLL